MIKAIIFDFDGVIAESVSVKTEAFAEIYRPYGNNLEQKVVEHHLANGGISRFEKFRLYHNEFLGVDLTESELADLADQFSYLVLDKVIAAPYVQGAYEFLSEYHHVYDFFISTGTPESEIVSILEEKQLMRFFRKVYGSPEKKTEHVSRILRNGNYQSNEVVFVGDSPSDCDAARKNNIPFIARVVEGNSQLKDEERIIPNLQGLGTTIAKLFDL